MAALILQGLDVYAIIGGVVAAAFLTVGIGRVSPDARGGYAFRPLLIPGVVLLWPAVLWRWAMLERGARRTDAAYRPPHTLQSAFAMVLIVAVPVVVLGALLIQQNGPREAQAVQISPPPTPPPLGAPQ